MDFDEPAPRAVHVEEVKYFLYTRDRRNVEISENNTEAFPTNYRNYLFVVHGWRSGRNKTWVENVTEVALNVSDVAIIQVDWSDPAFDLYAVAVLNVREVGKWKTSNGNLFFSCLGTVLKTLV